MLFFNPEKVRKDFPFLNNKIYGKDPVYFDNACSTIRPKVVIDEITNYYINHPTCAGRGVYNLSKEVTNKFEEARSIIAKFINAKKVDEVIYTRNTSEGLNLVFHSLNLQSGDVIITTDKEHNSNLIPVQVLKQKKGIVHKICFSKDGIFDIEAYKKLLNEGNVKLVSFVYTSNLDGTTIPAKEIIKLAHEKNALVMLDSAQTAPHKKIDVRDLDVDFLAFSGHKMMGPSGTGVLYGKYELLEKLDSFMTGGETVEYSTYEDHKFLKPPHKFEAGLQNYSGMIGFGKAVEYLESIGFKNIEDQEKKINEYLTEQLLKIDKVNIIGPKDPELRSGVIPFYINEIDSHEVAMMLDNMERIMVRSGQHCVHSWFNHNNIKTTIRASVYFYNTLDEAELFISTLNKILKVL